MDGWFSEIGLKNWWSKMLKVTWTSDVPLIDVNEILILSLTPHYGSVQTRQNKIKSSKTLEKSWYLKYNRLHI